MYDSGLWSRFKPQVFMIASTLNYQIAAPHPVTLNRHWANQPCFRHLMVNTNQGANFSVFDLT